MDIVTYALLKGKISSLSNVMEGLTSGFEYKGSVDSAENLPLDADVGDVYTVTDEDNEKYVWNGEEWIKADLKYDALLSDLTELQSNVGDLNQLDTTDKSSLVYAINEVLESLSASHFIPSTGKVATIDLTTSWSGNGPYTQTATVNGYTVTNDTMISVLPDADVLDQMINDGVAELFVTNSSGTVTVTAMANRPTTAMTLYVLCSELGAGGGSGSGLPDVGQEDNGKSLVVNNGEWIVDYIDLGYSKEDTLAVFYDSDVSVSQAAPDIYAAFFKPEEDPSLKYDVLYFSLDGNEPIAIPRIYQETAGVYFYGEFDFTNRMPIFTTYPLFMGAQSGFEVVYCADNFQHITIYNQSQEMVVTEDFKEAVEKSVDIGYRCEDNQILFFDSDVTMSSQGNYYTTAETIAGDPSERETLDFVLDDGETITVPRGSAFGMICYGEYNEAGQAPDFTNYPVFLLYSPPEAMIATESECHHIKISYTARNINVTDDFKEAVNYSVDLGYAYESGEPEIVIDEDVQASLQSGIYQASINYPGDLLRYDSLYITLNNGDVVALPKNYSGGFAAAYGDLAVLMGGTDLFNDYPATIVVMRDTSQSSVQSMVTVYEPEDFDHTTIGISTQIMTVSNEFQDAVETAVSNIDPAIGMPVPEADGNMLVADGEAWVQHPMILLGSRTSVAHEQTIDTFETYEFDLDAEIIAGKRYIVTINGVEYDCMCELNTYYSTPYAWTIDAGYASISSVLDSDPETGEYIPATKARINWGDSEQIITISIDYVVQSKINQKYLLDNIDNGYYLDENDNKVKVESIAEGDLDTNSATGRFSHAEGSTSIASAASSHAEGTGSSATGYAAHAEGEANQATNDGSHAEGGYSTASGLFSHSEGYYTSASNNSAHVEGYYATASGYASHAEGTETIASNTSSHAEGEGSTASGLKSHAEGWNTTSSGNASHSEGYGTTASGTGAHAEGHGGTFSINGVTYTSGAYGAADHAEGHATLADSNDQGSGGAHAEGAYTRATHWSAHAEGDQTLASNLGSHAEGTSSQASGTSSHAEGDTTTASGDRGSHSEGWGTAASGWSSHAEGLETTASGVNSHAEGANTTASGGASHAEGTRTTASGPYSHAEGLYTTANHLGQHVFGTYNVADPSNNQPLTKGNYVEIVGNGTAENATSNARTLDWSGNEVLQGSITLGAGTADETTITAAQLKALLALLV